MLYWFCYILTQIHHRCTCVTYPESPSHLPPHHPSGSSQCTSPEHPVSCIEPGLVICFTYDNIHVSVPLSQIIPPSPSPTESKRLFYTSFALLLSHIQGYRYHLSKFHIHALVYCIGLGIQAIQFELVCSRCICRRVMMKVTSISCIVLTLVNHSSTKIFCICTYYKHSSTCSLYS